MFTDSAFKAAVVAVGMLIAMPAFAGISNGESGTPADGLGVIAAQGDAAGALNVVLDGPAVDTSAPAEKASDTPAIDSTAKSLAQFSATASDVAAKSGDFWFPFPPGDGGNGGDCGGVVPEPASMLLMGIGLSAIGLRRKFAKQ